jgi:hypothetical protein
MAAHGSLDPVNKKCENLNLIGPKMIHSVLLHTLLSNEDTSEIGALVGCRKGVPISQL